MKRGGPIKAKRADERKRVGSDRDDSPRRAAVRKMECLAIGLPRATPCWGDVVAAHLATGPNEKGTALKVSDKQVGPMCFGHHAEYDGHDQGGAGRRSTFFGWSKSKRWRVARVWLRRIEHVLTPDTFEQAQAFQELGLGRIVPRPGAWAWLPGPARGEAA